MNLGTLAAIFLAIGADAPRPWRDGEHFTGEWNGDREVLAAHGLVIDLAYTTESFVTSARLQTGQRSVSLLGHLDAALTLDTDKLGLWPGGKLYVLGQNNHGTGINTLVGSSTAISNLEAEPFTQLTELFYEQSLFDDAVRVRIGKQDANREFGTPRYGGNFINNNFGMFPTGPLPSYPTTGLGAMLVVQPRWWFALKAGVFEGSPRLGSVGFDSAVEDGAGVMGALGAALSHRFGSNGRNGGTTSFGAWIQTGEIDAVADNLGARSFKTNVGVMVQTEEHLYRDPSNLENNGGLNVVVRFGWSQADRNEIPLYVGAAVTWHGITDRRDNDTVGIGFGCFQMNHQSNLTPGPGIEGFVEVFYKMRVTRFLSLQPDLQVYLHPGGDGPTTVLAGGRLKVKL